MLSLKLNPNNLLLKKHIPNIITSVNVFFGSLAVIAALQDNLTMVLWCVVISLVADFLDGFAARLLNVSGPMGKELDSLADMVSFGFLPSVLAYKLLLAQNMPSYGFFTLAFFGFLIAIFSAIRLAKFNLDTRQTENFIGLATPANTMFVLGLAILQKYSPLFQGIVGQQPWILFVLILGLSVLLVSELPMFSLKLKNFSWQSNKYRYLLIAGAVVIFLIDKVFFMSGVILWYLVLSLIYWKMEAQKHG